jgi:hypothetical protein
MKNTDALNPDLQYANIKMSKKRNSFEILPDYELRCQKVGHQIPMLHFWFLLKNGNLISSFFGGREYCPRSINAWLERHGALNTELYYKKSK